MKKEVTVIIPTCNRCKYLDKAIESMQHQTYPSNEYEIIVVDNCSTDNTRQIAEKWKIIGPAQVRYVFEPRPGLHHARHAGAKQANAEILLYVDDDVIVWSEWIKQMADTIKDKNVAAVGGRIIGKWECLAPDWLNDFGSLKNYGPLGLIDMGEGIFELKEKQYVFGGNLAIRKSVLFEVGGFNPDGLPIHLLKYRGDGECGLFDKLWKKKYSILYNSNAVIEHIITDYRLTKEYLVNRGFKEGFSAVFTLFRNSAGQKYRLALDFNICIVRFFYYLFLYSSSLTKGKRIKYRIFLAYIFSRAIHNIRVLSSNELQEYILRDTFIE